MEANRPIVVTRDLSIGYSTKLGVQAIASNLNLSLHSSRLISLVGANGIGKSTLLRTLTGIQKALMGTVLVETSWFSV